MSEVVLNKKVTNFTIDSTAGKFKLTDYKDKYIILFFYPRDLTPGCTQENMDFNAERNQFSKLNAEVFGISRDSLQSHEKFIEKHKLNVTLLSDENEEICNKFGVLKEKNMYGKKVWGIERSTFVIDPSGKLIKEWRKVKVPGHAKEVLMFLKSL